MLYMRCPTCGEVLGNKELIYEQKMKELCNSLGIDDDIVSMGHMDKHEEFIKKRQDIVQDLVSNICCRMRLITYIDIVQIIK